jgi:hypothetical protein
MTENPINWHELEADDFMRWALLILVSEDLSNGKAQYQEIQEATNKFKNIDVTMQLSGVEVNATRLLDRLFEQYQFEVEREAGRLVKDQIDRLRRAGDKLYDTLDNVERAVYAAMAEEGIIVNRDE